MYWLFTDEFNRQPTVNEFSSPALSPPEPVIRSMIARGQQVTDATALGRVAAGTVLVFAQDHEPRHSCIALHGNKIGGYNQTGWFTVNGVAGQYSSHDRSEVMWLTGLMNRHKVRGSNQGMHCKLIAIQEGVAKACVRHAVQP